MTIGTYQDASDEITTKILDGDELIGAIDFEIHMWAARGNGTKSQMAYDLGHEPGGVYLPLDDPDFLANTFVLPMRLEFKVRPAQRYEQLRLECPAGRRPGHGQLQPAGGMAIPSP